MASKIRGVKGFDQLSHISDAFKILSDPTRLKILCLLSENRDGLCVNDIADAVGISHSAASHQLAKLEARAVVASFREGQMICYFLAENKMVEDLEKVILIFRK